MAAIFGLVCNGCRPTGEVFDREDILQVIRALVLFSPVPDKVSPLWVLSPYGYEVMALVFGSVWANSPTIALALSVGSCRSGVWPTRVPVPFT